MLLKRFGIIGLLGLAVAVLAACMGQFTPTISGPTGPSPTVFSMFGLVSTSPGESTILSGTPTVMSLFSLEQLQATATGLSASNPVALLESVTPGVFRSGTPMPVSTTLDGPPPLTIPLEETMSPEALTALPPGTGEPLTGASSTPSPTQDFSQGFPTAQPTGEALAGAPQYRVQYIYKDDLEPGWQISDSWKVSYALKNPKVVHSGEYAISITPISDFGAVFLNRTQNSSQEVLRKNVAGIGFWISPGNATLDPDSLAVAVIGSNVYDYWVKDDNSVAVNYETKYFSETRLSLLGFNGAMRPRTWYRVFVWLNDLPYDPDYTYITGLYIKNDAGFKQTYYVDDVILITYE